MTPETAAALAGPIGFGMFCFAAAWVAVTWIKSGRR